MRLLAAMVGLATAAPARAGFWEDELKVGYTVGLNAVVPLGPGDDRAPIGVGLSGEVQRFWADSDEPHRVAPLITLAAHVGVTAPVVFGEVTAVAGPMYPIAVGDGGFLPLIGGQVGTGYQIATDGSWGAMVVGAVVGPYVEARVEATRWEATWHAPRLSIGPALSLTCCSYYF